MPRYFFHIHGKFTDKLGEELADDAAAWAEALHLCRDIEGKIEPGEKWGMYVVEAETPVFLLSLSSRKLR
jgi:hypothetical protein